MAQRLHLKELLNEYLRIFRTEFQSTLNLKSVIKGHIDFVPVQDVPARVNGIWIAPEAFTIDRVMLPKDLEITYNFRVVYVRRILVNEIVNEKKVEDILLITEKIIDKFKLEDLTLTNAQVLWSFPTAVDPEPPEDVYVGAIASELVATAFNIQTKVRTNHRL
jgi:hypothetical protein